jgi:glycogen debranching enzyme
LLEEVQLTWMDARVGDWVVTPRHGKPVEIQALWYNALRTMEDLSRRFGDEPNAAHYKELADLARSGFTRLFWNESAGCLCDVASGDSRDDSIRPNQVLAVSLFHSMLPGEQAKSVGAVVERDLLMPYGLRSLASSDGQYRGRYEGNPYTRDSGYHQGTVWPWLMGPFLTAYLKVHGRSAEARREAEQWLTEMRRFIQDKAVGRIPEVFDGEAPHRAGGCLAQAGSLAELFLVSVEDIRVIKPARRVAATAPVS